MPSRGWRARAGLLTAGGALAVHELRYLLAYGHKASDALALQGHAYLARVGPLLVALLLLALARWTARLAGAGACAHEPPPLWRLWGALSASLVGIYVAQESLEGLLEAGHPQGLAGLVGHGGWVAIPLAVAIGALIALVLRGGAAAVALRPRGDLALFRMPAAQAAGTALPPVARRLDVLACRLAARAPPVASV